jgi:hypothetical protein
MCSTARGIGFVSSILVVGWFALFSSPSPNGRDSATAAEPSKPSPGPAHGAPAMAIRSFAPPRVQREQDIVERKLDTVVPTVDFKSTRFADVLEFFRSRGPLTIVVNWDAIAGADVDQDTKVTLQLREVSLNAALRTVLHSIGALNDPLGYVVLDGTVRISTQAELAHITTIRVYDCEDLIQQPLTADQRQVMEGVIRERLVGAGHLSFEHALAVTMDDLRKQAAQDLIELIKTNVEPGTWQPEGTIGSISEFDGMIVIRHNAEAQEGVVELLTMLREAKAARTTPASTSGE